MLLCAVLAEGGGDGLGDCNCDCGAMGSDVGAGSTGGGGFPLDGVGGCHVSEARARLCILTIMMHTAHTQRALMGPLEEAMNSLLQGAMLT